MSRVNGLEKSTGTSTRLCFTTIIRTADPNCFGNYLFWLLPLSEVELSYFGEEIIIFSSSMRELYMVYLSSSRNNIKNLSLFLDDIIFLTSGYWISLIKFLWKI